MSATTHPLLDAKYLQEIYGGDQSILQIMFETFLEDSLTTWDEISLAIENQDFQKVGALTHQVKPSFSMVGLTHLHSKIKTLEDLSKNNPNKENVLTCYQLLDTEVKEAKDVITTILEVMNQDNN
ncbi:Hpt domain-containing protein [Arcicella sp. LKC2W]|uniref:Hpt domain-containing protein n=1 Tax=Arcicella sp. LKC2W TaxID=2984198 RepID=UPI002B1ED309|nr:Hpt domain-containing protein [Arcicella sp. LKC2W]MEA5460791.1 Hpt domain-containing protein [Arcicella sp. LKC2W]